MLMGNPVPDRPGHADLASDSRQVLLFMDVLSIEALLELEGNPFGKDGRKEIVDVCKLLGGYILILLLPQRPEGVGEHVVDVLYEDGAGFFHCNTPKSWFVHVSSFFSSSNQYSLRRGMIS